MEEKREKQILSSTCVVFSGSPWLYCLVSLIFIQYCLYPLSLSHCPIIRFTSGITTVIPTHHPSYILFHKLCLFLLQLNPHFLILLLHLLLSWLFIVAGCWSTNYPSPFLFSLSLLFYFDYGFLYLFPLFTYYPAFLLFSIVLPGFPGGILLALWLAGGQVTC